MVGKGRGVYYDRIAVGPVVEAAHKDELMDKSRFLTVGLLGALLSGCLGPLKLGRTHGAPQLGPAREVVLGAIESMGGLDAWRGADPIRATALVVVYDSDGGAHVDRQDILADLWAGTIRSTGDAARGRWTAKLARGGRLRLSTKGFKADAAMKDRLERTLSLLIHRLRGPLNLWAGREKVEDVSAARILGEQFVRVVAESDGERKLEYYFEPPNGRLRYVVEVPTGGAAGTLTEYEYTTLGNGLTLPRKIRLAKTGQYTLVSHRNILVVELSDVSGR